MSRMDFKCDAYTRLLRNISGNVVRSLNTVRPAVQKKKGVASRTSSKAPRILHAVLVFSCWCFGGKWAGTIGTTIQAF